MKEIILIIIITIVIIAGLVLAIRVDNSGEDNTDNKKNNKEKR